jgi:D-alanyl-lipoteichoic acid acyltransferase DltB (MBOAT superfamily)
MKNKRTTHSNFWFVWRAPIILAILTVFGLLAALLKTGTWHWAAWLALAVPIVVGLWFSFKRSSLRN